MPQPKFFESSDTFVPRHIGPTEPEIQEMLAALGLPSLEALVDATVPGEIRLQNAMNMPAPRGEQAVLEELRSMAVQNQVWRTLIGMGYYDCVTPPVIQRNILENPGWYTQYTPYQAEIAQGGSRRWSISRRWWPTSRACRWPMRRCWTRLPRRRKP